jgi:hypothetical protein
MSGLDTSQQITDDASEHAAERHLASRPHEPISGRSPLIEDEATPDTGDEATPGAGDEATAASGDDSPQ